MHYVLYKMFLETGSMMHYVKRCLETMKSDAFYSILFAISDACQVNFLHFLKDTQFVNLISHWSVVTR